MDDYVWILPQNGSSDVPIGAHVLAKFGPRIKIKDDDNNEYWVSPNEILRPMHPTSVLGVEDMISLGELEEYSILRNLLIRYNRDLIYTYIGSILVAVNPYKSLPIYGQDKMDEYKKKKLGELPPHIFAVADHSYESMKKKSEKRCLVISGESGAGKTESTKLFLRYFAKISHKLSGKEQQILDSNPILEAFGNAKTVCNDNSSRFGKYITIFFNADGSIQGAQIKQYLLEKSRIVSQNQGEQNYHIFYSLLTGLTSEEKRRLQLKTAASYKYLSRGSPNGQTNETYDIDVLKSAMRVLNFSDQEIWSIFEIVAAILHFGNIEFQTVTFSNTEEVTSINKEEIESICSLLKVSEKPLVDSLTKKTISTHGDNVVKFLSKQEEINSRDAFVKKIFGNLFNFIVEKINAVLSGEGTISKCHIGILDIFGFEAFDRNSFEQLCINYANEKLHQFFISNVFKIEQEQYEIEGINWKFIKYPDNTEVLNLIESGPRSILSVINDATKIPRGSDQSMLDKLIEFHSENPFFLKSKYNSTPVFGIHHYAGVVLYDNKDFVEKNHDACSLDIKQVIQTSNNNFLQKIFVRDFEADINGYHKKRMETLASKFKSSLDLLMNELNECQPFFIRCIKPNEMKKPQKFDRMLCSKQLKYSGMTEVTKVREAGYPVRYDFVQFVQHYRMLVPGIPLAHKTCCKTATQRICGTVLKKFPKPDYRLGRTRIFLKHAEELYLEAERERILYSFVVVIQKIIRGWLARRRFIKMKEAVAMAEKCWMEKQLRDQGNKIRCGFHRLLSKLKSRQLTLEFQRQRHFIVRLQALCKGYLIRSLIKRKLETFMNNRIEDTPNESADFKGFAKKYFQEKQNHKYSKKPIKTSLTRLVQPEEIAAAKAIWLTILRYTNEDSRKDITRGSASALVREILNAISSNGPATQEEDSERADTVAKVNRLYEEWLKVQKTPTEKIFFIVGHGIRRPELRDEIYCQICKVLTKNSSKKATHRGWNLLTFCTGCFPPSDLFLKYLKTFIRQGDPKYTSFCLFRLHRTIQNGSRTQPPLYTELDASMRQKPVSVEVLLTNRTPLSLKIDSATTANEMLNLIAKSIKLTDVFGFSLMLGQESKRVTLGDGSRFVMDAVSEYEQYAVEVGGGFENMSWKLYLKKEMFAPWYAFVEDEVSINLTYHQIKEGVITGEYGSQEKDLPNLIAKICYADKGKLQLPALYDAISNYIPVYVKSYMADDLESFKVQVINEYEMMFGKKERSVNSVRSEIVKHAASNWTVQFSRSFTVDGSIRNPKSIEPYPEGPLIVGVNTSGIFIIDESNEKRVVAKMDFIEIREITRKELTGEGYILKITNHEGVEVSLIFRSMFDADLHKLLLNITETMKNYSKFVISVKNCKTLDDSYLELRNGDFITLTDKFYGKDLLRNGWGEGFNSRSGQMGKFQLDSVEIIPAIQKPSESVIKAIRDVIMHGKRLPLCQDTERLKHYSLESYADEFFSNYEHNRWNGKPEGNPAELWKYSRENIRKPLLSKLLNKSKEAQQAIEVFNAILQYTEYKQGIDIEEELVSKIFSPGLENDDLRDETYCQLMKQLTSNLNKNSESKTWELMWMVTGLFPTGEILAHHVKKFLQSRRTIQIARDCLTRFNKVLDSTPRKHTCHRIEIEAVKKRPCYIFHRIYFPDNTNKFLQVNSLTTVKDLKEAIMNRLGISLTKKGYCILLQISERFFLLSEDYYIFDSLQKFKKWMKRQKTSKTNGQYKICFMKCNQNLSTGTDKISDLKFLFPQEYNKYIQGHFDISEHDIVQLAALLQKVFESNETTQQFQKIMEKLIPAKSVELMKRETWEKEIQATYQKHHSLTKEECKIQFLQCLKTHTPHKIPYFATLPETLNLTNYIFYPITLNSSFSV